MKLIALPVCILSLLILPLGAVAQEDEAGCKDSPLLTRLAGCHISNCSKSDFDAAELQISLSKVPAQNMSKAR